ncbi:DUF2779 domain-containing protein [Candidatus Woesearchaeota archaeon]|nr:DUF2779 domain-containing protein [Candidatus Woesearchaeota archaeon]
MLTKTKYLAGLSCPKYMWMLEHDADKLPELNEVAEHIIKQGHEVGKLAQTLFKKGISIPEQPFLENLKQTQILLKEKKPLFEASFMVDNLYARADILVPKGKKWDIVEVKSSTSVKEDNLHDISFQRYVYEKAGIKINKCYLAHINNAFIRKGEIKAKKLIKIEEVTKEVDKVSLDIDKRIEHMLSILAKKDAPDIKIGKGCENGTDCPSQECWSFLPEAHVFELWRGGKKSYELLEGEVLYIKDIPDDYTLTDKQEIQKEAVKTGKVYKEEKKIQDFLKSFQQPVYYLDFETFATAIPLFDRVKPYQQIPFQFSCHKVEGTLVTHMEYLHREASDPRRMLLDALKKALGENGSIIVYNQSFEKKCLEELGSLFPKEKKWAASVCARMLDLAIPFKNFWYYHPAQKGKYSIKSVMPALTGKGYEDLEIGKGDLASMKYLDLTFHNGKDKEKVYNDLLVYCGQDTEGMIWIVEKLRDIS